MSLFAPKQKKIAESDGKVNIKWLPSKGGSIIQIYSSGLEYALCNADFQQCHDLVYCKDFLQDAIHAHLYGGSANIYGFSYNSKTQPPISVDRLRIICVNSNDSKFLERVPNVLDFLNQFCKNLGIKACKAFQVSNPPSRYAKNGVFLIDASGMWNNAPVLVSLFTLLLRVGFVHKKGDDCMETLKQLVDGKIKPYQNNDRSYVQQSMKGIERILEHGYRKFFFIDIEKNYPKGTNIGTIHNQTGIVAFSSGSTKSVCKYWTRRSATDPEFAKELEEKKKLKEQQEKAKTDGTKKAEKLATDAFNDIEE
jgi:hypothetical protein